MKTYTKSSLNEKAPFNQHYTEAIDYAKEKRISHDAIDLLEQMKDRIAAREDLSAVASLSDVILKLYTEINSADDVKSAVFQAVSIEGGKNYAEEALCFLQAFFRMKE